MTTNSWVGGGGIFNFGSEGSSNTDWSLGHTPASTEDAVVNTGASGLLLGATSNEHVNSISLGSNDALLISGDTLFAAFNGTGPNGNSGTISLNDADLLIGNASSTATFDNAASGSIALNGTSASAAAQILINGSVNLTGSGSIKMQIGDPVADNTISGNGSSSDLTNVSEDISGTGTIGGDLNFTNKATVETNNNTSSNGGTLAITGSATVGSFTNAAGGLVEADNGGTLIFGVDSKTSTIANNGGVIGLNASSSGAKLKIAGNVTISGSTTGDILLGGSNPLFDQILSDGKTASLTLVGQSLKGAGIIGDEFLTLDNQSLVDASIAGQGLYLETGFNTITNSAGATLEASSGVLAINSAVNNAGTIEAVGQGAVVAIDAAVTGSGAVDIGSQGTLSVEASISGNVAFTGTNATLDILDGLANGGIAGEVAGISPSDSVDFGELLFSANNSLHWSQTSGNSGVLSLVSSSGMTLASIALEGSFITPDFSMSKDIADATLVTLEASVPWSVPDDFGDDGISNVLWRDSISDQLVLWSMNGSTVTTSALIYYQGNIVAPDSSWSPAGIGDFNGDGTSDVLWRNTSNTLSEWLMNGATIQTTNAAIIQTANSPTYQGSTITPDSTWSVAVIGDFNGDGDADMLWWQSSTGTLAEWLMNGATIQTAVSPTYLGNTVSPDSTWSVAGVGDFNGDGNTDLLWRNSNGTLAEWLMNGGTVQTSASPIYHGSTVMPDSTWSVAAVGDFNGDGNADVLWRQSSGTLALWQMIGSTIEASAAPTYQGNAITPDSTWKVVDVGDFTSGGNASILWQQSTTNSLVDWQMNGAQIASSNFVTSSGTQLFPATVWQVQGTPTNFN